MNLKNSQISKKATGDFAATLVKNGMIIGLGTGTTSAFFIQALSEKVKIGLDVSCVATSNSSHLLAKELGLKMIDINSIDKLDFCFDGADEIDSQKQMIKGGGGALLREKIVAHMSQEMVVLVDESKLVTHLGKFPLAIEIIPFAYKVTLHELQKLGCQADLRKKNNEIFITDNDNYIVDLNFKSLILNPSEMNLKIKTIPGIVETGLFINMAGRVIVGFNDGHIEVI